MSYTSTPNAGAKLRASVLASLITETRPAFAIKSGTTPRASTTTPTDDPDLTVALTANITYVGKCVLYTSSVASSAGDLTFQFTIPTGASVSFGVLGLVDTIASGYDASLHSQTIEATSSPTSAVSVGCSSSFTVVSIDLAVVMGSSDGSLTLQWAQSVSNANATNVRIHSYIDLKPKP